MLKRDFLGSGRIGRTGTVAIVLAIVGGILALINEILHYRHTGTVDWGHAALAFGVPALIYTVVRAGGRRQD